MPTYQNDGQGDVVIEGLDNNPKTLKPGETGQSYKVYDLTGLTKINDEPYFPLAVAKHILTFAQAETKSASGLLSAKVLRVSTNVQVEIAVNAAANPYSYTLDADKEVDIKNSGEIESLYLTSTGEGSARIIALPE